MNAHDAPPRASEASHVFGLTLRQKLQVRQCALGARFERRLDRQLVQEDLATAPWNAGWIDMDTLRDELRMRDPDASDAFKEMNEKWMARRAPGRRLLP